MQAGYVCCVADKSRMEPLVSAPVRRIGHSCCAHRAISTHREMRGGSLVGHGAVTKTHRGSAMTLDEKLDETATHVAPYVLSIARVVIALMFMEHGTSKLFGFPAPTATPDPFTLLWFAAIIEIVGGALLALGLGTRLAAFIMSGEMAIG